MKSLHSKLLEKAKTLPEGSPVPSPTVDAPSPENSDEEDLSLPDSGSSGKLKGTLSLDLEPIFMVSIQALACLAWSDNIEKIFLGHVFITQPNALQKANNYRSTSEPLSSDGKNVLMF